MSVAKKKKNMNDFWKYVRILGIAAPIPFRFDTQCNETVGIYDMILIKISPVVFVL